LTVDVQAGIHTYSPFFSWAAFVAKKQQPPVREGLLVRFPPPE
jgi:hypothetical protein